MELPKPEPGRVIRYEFLWRDEAEAGLEYGEKPRPCAIIVAVINEAGRTDTVVASITHTPPTAPAEGIEVPAQVRAHLGLDEQLARVVVTDLNVFAWPGFDLSPIPGRDPPTCDYGMLPSKLFDKIKTRILAVNRQLKSATSRDQSPTGQPDRPKKPRR